ncbi:MAG: 4-(cytidine 5'-diphospho)-2-C-methyl-D-erythritol kinase [Bacteroidia bacterium]|nr:4-(cytidine 5'-diphospho)-2-C-methyl-D-erythritol kinase [Bacteroidia bacterium]
MVVYCYPKINIGLFIKGKRPDGYHLLETVFVPVLSIYDTLEASILSESRCDLTISGNEVPGNLSDNLIFRAWQLLRQEVPELPGFSFRLKKQIPIGAGLGGGSANAGYALLLMQKLSGLDIPKSVLQSIALKLGADVPFFLENKPMYATGIGEILSPYVFSVPFRIELITPPIHSDTRLAYQNVDLSTCSTSVSLREVLAKPISEWKNYLRNDLEQTVFTKYPELAGLKQSLYDKGAFYASMSGSGSAIYGLFEVNS